MEKIRTINYKTLEENFHTTEEALALSDTVSIPFALVERSAILLWDYIECHLNIDAAQYDAIFFRDLLVAKLESIHDHLQEATAMLMECNTFVSEIKEKEGDMER